MENKELLYELEYKVQELRKQYLNYAIYEEKKTLKQILDLGFDIIYINNNELYKDNEENYIVDGYYIDKNDNILNAIVKYVDYDFSESNLGSYLYVIMEFENKDFNNKLEEIKEI